MSEGWYLQDTRSYVGNDMLFWAKDGNGYTTDVSKAHVYTREEAFRQHVSRNSDRPWPKAYIDGKTRPAVDMQYVKYAEAIAVIQNTAVDERMAAQNSESVDGYVQGDGGGALGADGYCPDCEDVRHCGTIRKCLHGKPGTPGVGVGGKPGGKPVTEA